jgi:fatty-acyl-CoA synthase
VERIHASVPTIRKYILITDKREEPIVKWADAEYEALLAGAAPLAELPELDENTLATQSYTTGTTGKPKGVYFTQRQLTLQALSTTITLSALGNYGGVTKDDVYMPLTPMFHVHAWGMPYVGTMLGLKQVYPGKYEPPMLLRLIVGERVTFSHCVPTIIQTIVNAPAIKGVDLSQWKVVIGGAALPKGLAVSAAKLGIKIYAGYGMSETAPVLTISNLKPPMESWDEDKKLDWMIKAGTVIPLVDLQVVDAGGKPVARDSKETGEIVVRAPWCTPGYYKEPERSAELWAGDWMHTGDVATLDQYGYVQIVDRLKDIIKSGGEWIVSLELENLLSLHEGVLEASVIGVPDEKWGERPLAIIVPRAGYKDQLTPAGLKAHLSKYVESGVIANWSVPDAYIVVDEIPRTSVGKHDKKLLRSQFAVVPQ